MKLSKIVPRDEWLLACKALLIKEKEMHGARDAANIERHRQQMVRTAKDYATLAVSR